MAGTEELAPGATLPKHRHLVQDEIVLLHSGTAHIWLGDQERDLHAGGLVFIPANTWVSLRNIGADPVSLTFIFSAPGFDDTMRCNSVLAGEEPTQITPEQQKDCCPSGACRRRRQGRTAKEMNKGFDGLKNYLSTVSLLTISSATASARAAICCGVWS